MITNGEIIREFDTKYPTIDWRGYPSKDEIKRFLLLALSQQKQEMAEKIEDSINLHKILKLNCKDNDKIEKKEAHDIVIEAFKKLKQNQTK